MRNASSICMTSKYSKTFFSPFAWNERSRRFRKSPLREPFSKTCDFGAKKRRLHVDGRLTRRKKSPISKISEYVWTGPIVSKTKIIVLPFSCFFTNQSKINVTSKQNLSKNKRTQSIQIFD